nr:odorant-binding protein [Lasioderma serricorne]
MKAAVAGIVAGIVALVAVVAAQELTPQQRETIRTFRQDCLNETKVDPNLVYGADRGEFPEDEKLKCFAKCFYRKVGFIDDAAELKLDYIKSKIPEGVDRKKALDVIEKCKDTKGTDACDKAFKLHKCYFENTALFQRNVKKD